MKILELRFKNLNSLYGDWLIDFTAPEYVSNGIFAIIGPTGAGKSTIMDAICLALYGTTPRLGRITATDNEIMSRQTGECQAEVVFESQAGRFRCVWSQHRARKRADGKLAEPRHEISDARSGQVLEAQRRNVLRVIEDLTGMDFDRFTRSILLAQGGFASFLQAAPDQRAPVLEQITGTEIYSEISRSTHERSREERDSLGRLQAEIAGMSLMTDEESTLVANDLDVMVREETELAGQNIIINTACQWLMTINSLRTELDGLAVEQADIRQRLTDFLPGRERLRVAIHAAELDGEFATLSTLRQQLLTDQASLKLCVDQLPQSDEILRQASTRYAAANEHLLTARQEQQNLAPLLTMVRSIDQQIAGRQRDLAAALTELDKIGSDLAGRRSELEQAIAAQQNVRRDLAEIQAYIDTNQADQLLVTELTGIAGLVSQLTASTSEAADRQGTLQTAREQVALLSGLVDSCQHNCQDQRARHEQLLSELTRVRELLAGQLGGRLLRDYQKDYETLLRERVLLQKIASLEEERQRLVDGQACPLCGATEHPFAAGNMPVPDDIELQVGQLSALLETISQLDLDIRELEAQETTATASLSLAEKMLSEAGFKMEKAQAEADRLAAALLESEQRCQLYRDQLLATLHPLVSGDLTDENLLSILGPLRDRQQKWLQNQTKKQTLESADQALAAETGRLLAIIGMLEQAWQEKQTAVEQHRRLLSEQTAERSALFADQQPDEAERLSALRVRDAELQELHQRDALAAARTQVESLRVRQAALQETIQIRQQELGNLTRQFAESLRKANFSDETDFLAARLSAAERNELSSKAQDLDRQWAESVIRIGDRQTRLAAEQDRKLTDEPLDELADRQKQIEGRLRQLGEKIGASKQRLADNQTAQIIYQGRQQAIELQKTECRRWDRLHALIGSADGKKYRNFAQGLTFELMVRHANRQLAGMTDRYLLICDQAQPLELNVIDNYQAGEIRSTKNLSGGESFIVSLALALGLSKMASRKVRVDSLFLDEGFGTLDEDALETALETLAGLHQDGKLIGIISHVPALKERISTQITITPRSGGKSKITGPGVVQGGV